jgi:GntR family phosphonate transport system transcriptional regulator
MSLVERHCGIALWRQIADQIRVAIGAGEFDGQPTLPGEFALAERFEVNRHTVRSAIASLTKEGVLRVEQGRGTFIARRARLRYPIGRRTRFTTGFAGQTQARQGLLRTNAREAAPKAVADALRLPAGAPVIRLETVSTADAVTISSAIHWFDAERFPDFAEAYRQFGSITACLKSFGVDDYVRISTHISAHHASPQMLVDLQLSPGDIVLVTEAVNAELDGTRLEYSRASLAADRVEIEVDHSAGQFGIQDRLPTG